MRQIIDVTEIIETQKLNGFIVRLVLLSLLITFFDGYDINAVSFAAPNLIRVLHVTRPEFGAVFGIGLFGIMLGGFLFGFLGDRYGRRPTIILSAATFGALTLAAAFSATLTQLIVLRFLGGLAIGGMLPVGWALNIEYAPKRYRATIITTIMLGYSFGSAAGGFISALLSPIFGWPVIFWVGGLLPMLVALLFVFTLPESIKYLTVKQRRLDEVARIVRRLRPGIVIAPDARFIVADEMATGAPAAPFTLAKLFEGRLLFMTPLLWLAYIGSSMAVFFLVSWMPTLAESAGLAPSAAALAASLLSVGGGIAGLVIMRFVDRFGAIVLTIMPLIACPLVGSLGLVPLDQTWFMVAMFVVGFFVIGGHTGLHSIAGIFYPSAYRSNGAGWAVSVAKVGSIAGPWIGGILLGMHLPLSRVFLFAALPPVLFAVCVFFLGLLHNRLQADERRAPHPALATQDA